MGLASGRAPHDAAWRATSRAQRSAQAATLLLAAFCLVCPFCQGREWRGEPSAGAAEELALRRARRPRRLQEPDTGTAQDISTGVLLANAFGLFYMFLALAIVCDEFFVPSLDVLTEELGISPDIAGATFMAAGGSAPEFFTAMAGALSDPPSDVGISTIVGSAVFNVLFVIGVCGIMAPGKLQLSAYPLSRDCIFYVVDLFVLAYCFCDDRIEWWEALLLFGLYVAYCVFMSFSDQIESRVSDDIAFRNLDLDGDGEITLEEAKQDTEVFSKFHELDTDRSGTLNFDELRPVLRTRRQLQMAVGSECNEDLHGPLQLFFPSRSDGLKVWSYYVIAFPINLILILTIPDVRREGSNKLFPLTFVLSIVWVAMFSSTMVQCAGVIGDWTGIDTRVLGLTLLAAGTSVPDLLTSVLVTMQGHGDMAISSSIGSNIFDITVGLPVPWLVYSAYYGGKAFPVESQPHTMFIQIGTLIAMIMFTVGGIRCSSWVLAKSLGYAMLTLYVGFIAVSIWQILRE